MAARRSRGKASKKRSAKTARKRGTKTAAKHIAKHIAKRVAKAARKSPAKAAKKVSAKQVSARALADRIRELDARAKDLEERGRVVAAKEETWRNRETRRDIVARITSKAWTDEAFKQRLLEYPIEVLEEFGIPVPDGLEVRVLADVEGVLEHGVLLAPPSDLTPAQRADPRNVHFVFCFTSFHHRHDRPVFR